MKPLYLLSLTTLLSSGFLMACYADEAVPVQTGVGQTTTPRVPTPSDVPTLAATGEPKAPPGPGQNVAPPPVGIAEMQPLGPDAGTRARQVIQLADQQIDRLSHREAKAVGSARDDIDSFLTELTIRRDKVQQEYRDLQTQEQATTGTLAVDLDREIAGLRDAINDSYQLENPAGHALPPPAPIPLDELP